jgi:hypothetical protein
LTPPAFLVILRRFRKNAAVCLNGGCVWARWPGDRWPELMPRARSGHPARQIPGIALFLRRAGANRYGARAYSTLEGYAGRNRETELASPRRAPGHRPGFRLKLERRQTRSSNDRASVRVRHREWLRIIAAGSPIGLRAACEVGSSTVFGVRSLVCLHSISWFARGARPRGTRRPHPPCRPRRSGAAFALACIHRRPRSRTRRCARLRACG